MDKIKITDLCYGEKVRIRCLGSVEKYTNSVGTAGLGYCKARPSSFTRNAKFSGAAYVLDKILIDKVINALELNDEKSGSLIYGEYTDSAANVYKFTAEDSKNEISFDGTTIPTNYDLLVPVVLLALHSDMKTPELKENFIKCAKEYKDTGECTMQSVLSFCDAFYWEFIQGNKMEEFTVFDDDLEPGTIKQSYEHAKADFIPVLDGIEGLPMLSNLEGVEIRKKKATADDSSVDATIAACIEGKNKIAYDWSEKQKLKIPDVESLNDFIPSDAFYSILKKIGLRANRVMERWDSYKDNTEMTDDQKRLKAIAKDYINLFIVGKPGTGKTTAAYALGAALGMPVYTVAITKNTEEDTFQGMTKVVNGNFSFVSTDFLDAYTNGGIIVLEEVNLADPAVIMGALGQAVEAPFILLKDGYEVVRRHPMCIIISTMNIGTNGAKGVSQAFSSRFKQTYILDDPREEDFVSILVKQGHDRKRCKWVYDAYTRINDYLKSPEVNAEDICLNVTLRGCIGALENWEEGDTPREAICNTLVGKIAEVDLEIAEHVKNEVVDALRDPR